MKPVLSSLHSCRVGGGVPFLGLPLQRLTNSYAGHRERFGGAVLLVTRLRIKSSSRLAGDALRRFSLELSHSGYGCDFFHGRAAPARPL